MPDGSVVMCDITTNKIIPKELFDAIKGRDIKIVFEQIFGNKWNQQGIQCIFNGKDISKSAINSDTPKDKNNTVVESGTKPTTSDISNLIPWVMVLVTTLLFAGTIVTYHRKREE